MVIETFRGGDLTAVGERFARHGRMLPEEVVYHASWMDPSGARCFQIMEAPDQAALDPWLERWSDLVGFEVVPVMTSGEFWARRASR